MRRFGSLVALSCAAAAATMRPQTELVMPSADAAYVRSRLEAQKMLTAHWLDQFFSDTGDNFRQFTAQFRNATYWEPLRAMSDVEIWDALMSPSPPWANATGVPCDSCVLCDRWKRFELYKCVWASDDFSPNIEKVAMGQQRKPDTGQLYGYPLMVNPWYGTEAFGSDDVALWLPPVPASTAGGSENCRSRQGSVTPPAETNERFRTYNRGVNPVMLKKAGTENLLEGRSGLQLVGPGFNFVALDYLCDPGPQCVALNAQPAHLRAAYGGRPLGVHGSAGYVERYVSVAESRAWTTQTLTKLAGRAPITNDTLAGRGGRRLASWRRR